MDQYRYFIFNQRSMVVLGLLQIACAGVTIVSGFMDGAFRKQSALSNTKAPIWAGVIMSVPGVLALFSSQKKNPVLVNSLIVASVFSCFTTTIIIIYACLTLRYGEDDDEVFSHTQVHIIHMKYILNKFVQGANIAMLIASVCSFVVVLAITYMGCRSLPHCRCFDNVTGMEWLQPTDDQPQTLELVCSLRGGEDRMFNSSTQSTDNNLEDDEESLSKPPPYIRLA
ncbi:uncharacterized protein LOC115461697 [Microcaecilia unicolor]|uniref:Uncharacterized protein LOC115461697 n=1 Tax=Microcaecilia unicolor TaxID=1415580 RepID=A0A6P7X533_9AMPH|nr:uncharacterized protein LOC115461697 [Microcaecilia unicolor]XP_030047583.1 uncharacterized protein LOC115461697 [Microcaecilia unicolor]XP_030047584.1 uncharacterized protein LOC115461697 [Microcaecilia unicolor]XP_030047585.1 uncharacterized protein LOC115461697 [Microcaecilia unicolor]